MHISSIALSEQQRELLPDIQQADPPYLSPLEV